ncbi:MAG: hypothetical protein LLG05_11930 [Porphyromonadaceae bacterium]|nr:hypothetical protein [Porphyromonadaceae bacterium]
MNKFTRGKNYYISIILSIMVIFVFFCINEAESDELFLTGTVLEVSQSFNQAVVNVKTLSCRGKMTFKADDEDIRTLQGFLGKDISFFIDSANCNDKLKTYKIKKLHIKASKGARQ